MHGCIQKYVVTCASLSPNKDQLIRDTLIRDTLHSICNQESSNLAHKSYY